MRHRLLKFPFAHKMMDTKTATFATTPLPADLPPIQPHFPLALHATARSGFARANVLQLPHGPVETPVFMPVGTQGTIKGGAPPLFVFVCCCCCCCCCCCWGRNVLGNAWAGMTTQQVDKIGYQIILGNTYHLGLRPVATT